MVFTLEVFGTGKKNFIGRSHIKYVEKYEIDGLDGNILKK
jgi:hypothetical protein